MAPTRPDRPLRSYSILFVGGVVAVALILVIAAVSSSGRDRGGYIGMAVLWGAGALAAVALLVAIERKRRQE